METGRADLNAMLKVSSIPSDEPVFVLRAQDGVAADAVRAWAQLALTAGADLAVVESALAQADRMEAWPVKKIADADHLSEAQRKRLAAHYRRRQWDMGALHPTEIAERRGRAQALDGLLGADGDALLALLGLNIPTFAALFRRTGEPIPEGAAAERQWFIHRVLQLVIEFGAAWRGRFEDEIERRSAILRAEAERAALAPRAAQNGRAA